MSNWGIPNVTQAGTPSIADYRGNLSFRTSYYGAYPFPMLSDAFYISGKQYESHVRLQMMLATWMCGMACGFAVMPTIAQRVGDEMPFRSDRPLMEEDTSGSMVCWKCQKWVPPHDLVVVDGNPYCRRHARQKKMERIP